MLCAKCGQLTKSEFHGLCDACYFHIGRAKQSRIDELEAENAALKSTVEKFTTYSNELQEENAKLRKRIQTLQNAFAGL